MSKERLEEVKHFVDLINFIPRDSRGMGEMDVVNVQEDMKWLIEQAERVQFLEMRWELLKLELEQSESLNVHLKNDEAVDTIHDIQNLMSKMESGVYYKEFHE